MSHNLPDLALLLQVLEARPCQRAVNLHSVDESGNGDETVGLDILVELLGSGLVKNDSVLGLVLDCVVQFVSRVPSVVTIDRCGFPTPIPTKSLDRLGTSGNIGAALTPALRPLLLLLLASCSCGRHYDCISC